MNRFNIYCGVRSIGWNVVTDENEVIAYGAKRVNVDFDSYYDFIAGLPVAKRIDRRMKRQMRRNLWRYRTRRAKLLSLLKADGMLPGKEEMQWNRKTLNSWRDHIACYSLSDNKKIIGRVLLDMQAKRGYKSMRGVDDTGDSQYLKTIEMHENALKDFTTVGAYLGSLESCKNVILRRETCEREFYEICAIQALNPERYYGAIFYQRPLKKGKIAFCRCEPNRKVTHASNPVYQRFRCLRDVNNIEIFDIENNQIEISDEHRAKFLEQIFDNGKDLTKAAALKIMDIKKSAQYKWYSGKSIAGNLWAKLCPDTNYNIWQDMISATDNTKLVNILLHKGFSLDRATELAEYDIKGMGYADYSVKSIKKLLPHLAKGKTLNESILEVYGKVDFGAGAVLRNVVLEQVHASCSALVKAVKAKYEIDEMQIEIDSLLKMGNKARKARASARRRAEKDNVELNRTIVEAGAEPTEYNRKKLRLWDESGGICPYFPEIKIELKDLFTDKYNLDHIVPKSKLFDFSQDNLVICPTVANFEKLRMTGAEFVLGDKKTEWNNYVKVVNALKISERKKGLLLMGEQDIPTDYISRSAGTDYNTRCFLMLHPNSRCIPNKLVNMYAKGWYGKDYDENDVRNVLVKSFAIANMSGETIEYFDRIREKTDGKQSAGAYDLQAEIVLPDLSEIPVYCPRTKFFRHTKFGYTTRFALHKESVYGQRKRIFRDAKGKIKEEIFYKIRQPLGKLTSQMVANISDKAIQRLVVERYEKEGKNFAVSVQENPIMFDNKAIRSVSVNVNSKTLTPLHSAADGLTGKFSAHVRKVDYVYNSMNYSFVIENGKKKILSLLQAVNDLNAGNPLAEGFHRGDSVMYEGKQYIISGLEQGAIALRSVYTLLAENVMKISRVSDIEKLTKTKIPQV